MTPVEQARELDRLEQPEVAIAAYERVIAAGLTDRQAYLDLALLYFQVADFGYAAAMRVPLDLWKMGDERSLWLLDESERRYGPDVESSFWRLYISRIHGVGDEFVQEANRLIETGRSLAPFMYLLVMSGAAMGREGARKLWEEVKDGRSTRDRYIRCILEGEF